MITNDEIRLQNLRHLRAEAGTLRALAERCQTSEAYLSQINNRLPDSKSGTPKNIGDKLARKLEHGMGKPPGWLDAQHHTPNHAQPASSRVAEPPAPDYTDPRRKRLMQAFDRLLDDQIDKLVSEAESTAKRNEEIAATLEVRKNAA